MGQEHAGKIFLGVDPEDRAGGAAPEQLPFRPHGARRRHAQIHSKAEAKADPLVGGLAKAALGPLGEIAPAGQVVRTHERQSFRTDNAYALEGAAPEQHAAKTQVIVRRGQEATAAGEEGRRLAEGARARLIDAAEAPIRGALVIGGKAMPLRLGHGKARIDHLQGPKDFLFKELVEGQAAHALHEQAADVRGEGVVPGGPGREQQGQRREALGEGIEGKPRPLKPEPHLAIGRIHVRGRHKIVGQAAHVGEQVLHGHGTIDGASLEVGIDPRNVHPLLRPLGNPAMDGIAELKDPALVKHHERHGSDRLGHGVDPEDGVFRHGRAGSQIPLPLGLQVGQLAPAPDRRQRPRELPLRQILAV